MSFVGRGTNMRRLWLTELGEQNPDLANQIHVFSSFFYKKLNNKKRQAPLVHVEHSSIILIVSKFGPRIPKREEVDVKS